MKIEDVKIGTKVRMVNCYEARKYGDKTWEIRSEPWECCGSVIVGLKGKSGGFDISCLELVHDESSRENQRTCPRCENEEIESDHQFCKICGLKL